MSTIDFGEAFNALTGNPPFPWQEAMYDRLVSDRVDNIPDSCNLPTGLGKTSVIAIWLVALRNHPDRIPRRLVYVVNRRTVVDQTTDEAEKLRNNAAAAGVPEPAISTLRGQFADNREWSADPSRPAVICGTVDMIGSRLLFSGYGIGFKSRPLHAGFLGQDVLLVHDEAHLEPAFQRLIEAIREEQHVHERTGELSWPKLRVMALTATSRGAGKAFELTDREKAIPAELPQPPREPIHYVWQRMMSKKGLSFHPAKRDAVAQTIGQIARQRWMHSGKAILIFVRTIDDVKTVQDELTRKLKDGAEELRTGVPAANVQLLTGTIRGLERDELASRDPVFARFMPKPKVPGKEGTVFLICTSAGEVGVDISADHMVCDLTTLDSMAQRFGRVNRRGDGEAEIDLIYEADANAKPPSPEFEAARWRTKAALEHLTKCDWIADRFDASPAALGVLMAALTSAQRDAAFAPQPAILPATDFLFDAWSLTTIRGKLPGRPHVEPYLHGISEWQPPETHVAWREEVGRLQTKCKSEEEKEEREAEDRKALAKLAAGLLDDYPLLPHELLREPSYRAFKHFEAIAKRRPDDPVWLLDEDSDTVEILTIEELADKNKKERIDGKTVLLPPSAGGLKKGMLDGASADEIGLDVADAVFIDPERTRHLRVRVDDPDDEATDKMRLIRRIDFDPLDGDEDTEGNSWYWFGIENTGEKSARLPVLWRIHVDDVIGHARRIVANLPLEQKLKDAIIVAAQLHDHGKKRRQFQIVLNNREYPGLVLAKSGSKTGGRVPEIYRHEFGSLLEMPKQPEFLALTDPDMKELVLHLIATHHGRARPHFPEDEAFDPEPPTDSNPGEMAISVPQRFARLQRRYGRWGLAYLESLLRAADWAASANPSAFVGDEK